MDREQRIAAFVDGELQPADRAAFEAELRGDPALAAAVERQSRLRARLAAAYDPVLAEPVPPHLTAAASTANDAGPARFGLPQWAAMAACLATGVLLGQAALPGRGPVAAEHGQLLARGDLARTLDRGLTADAAPIRVGLSFRSREGGFCRTFTSSGDGLAGLACRQGARWETRTLTAWKPAPGPAYRTAGADTPPEILAAVDGLIAGEPLDQAGERAARARAWRP
jgi:hypothetical protein